MIAVLSTLLCVRVCKWVVVVTTCMFVVSRGLPLHGIFRPSRQTSTANVLWWCLLSALRPNTAQLWYVLSGVGVRLNCGMYFPVLGCCRKAHPRVFTMRVHHMQMRRNFNVWVNCILNDLPCMGKHFYGDSVNCSRRPGSITERATKCTRTAMPS